MLSNDKIWAAHIETIQRYNKRPSNGQQKVAAAIVLQSGQKGTKFPLWTSLESTDTMDIVHTTNQLYDHFW